MIEQLKPCHCGYDGALAEPVEPAPAQDEREAVVVVACIDLSTDTGVVLYANRDHWLDNELLMTVAQHERIVATLTRPAQLEKPSLLKVTNVRYSNSTAPAQTEQQPLTVPEGWKLVPVQPTEGMLASVTASTFEPLRKEVMEMAREDYRLMLYAAPIAQTAPQPIATHKCLRAVKASDGWFCDKEAGHLGECGKTAPQPEQSNIDPLLNAGAALSNIAFNLAQRPGVTLDQYVCDLLSSSRKHWEEARAALPATPSPAMAAKEA